MTSRLRATEGVYSWLILLCRCTPADCSPPAIARSLPPAPRTKAQSWSPAQTAPTLSSLSLSSLASSHSLSLPHTLRPAFFLPFLLPFFAEPASTPPGRRAASLLNTRPLQSPPTFFHTHQYSSTLSHTLGELPFSLKYTFPN